MSKADWLRTFVAVYRSGSVTSGARIRGVSQPAASQQLAALSRAVGGPLLTRVPGGVAPTEKGRELYGRVAEHLDRLEEVLVGLDRGAVRSADRTVRVGATAELFESQILPLLASEGTRLTATFGDDARLAELVLSGDLDVAIVTSSPARRVAVDSVMAGRRSYVLVSSPATAPIARPRGIAELASWLSGRPWVTFSGERPVTRRFWTAVLGHSFDAEVMLTAPDLRAVVAAVELGVGVSLLPAFVCTAGLAGGRLVEVYDVSTLVPADPWYAVTRRADAADPRIVDVVSRLVGCLG